MKTFDLAFPKATMYMAINKSLFAQVMYSVPNVCDESVPTACTTGTKRLFNEEWLQAYNHKQIAGVMAHECLHDMLLHQARRGAREPRLWNISCDVKVNRMLQLSNFELPAEGLHDLQGEYDGMTEEQIYDYLLQNPEKRPADGSTDDFQDIALGTPTADEVATAKGRLQQAIEMHGVGQLPSELREAIETLLNPKEQWHEWLRRYFTSKQYSGCDWTAMCRRQYVNTGMIAPPFQSDSLGTVVISVDQSGSVSSKLLEEFAGHVNSILMDCRPSKVVVQYFDTEVHEVEEFTPADLPITLRRVCGGGTSFVEPCEMAEQQDAVVHIVLTDGCAPPPPNVITPTVWASSEQGLTMPFGEVIYIGE